MSFPTTLWGNTYDVYATVPGPTASSPGSSDGPVLGNFALLADGTQIQFLQLNTTTSTAAGAAMRFDTSFANYSVKSTSAINQLVAAINDLSGGSPTNPHSSTSGAVVTNAYCAWLTRKGLCFPLVAASVGAKAIVASSSTAGQLYAATAGTDLQGTIANQVVVGGSPAVSPCVMT